MTDITQGFIELGIKQASLCRENPTAYINTLVTANSQRLVLMNVYGSMVRQGLLKKIEDMEESEKRSYWQMAKADAGGRLPEDKLKMLCRCLYCLDHLLSNY
jgi:hypothetical protein